MHGQEKETLKAVEKAKASVRAFVEHPFHIVKNIFRHRKVRHRGLAKNGHQLHTLFGLANVLIGARALSRREKPRVRSGAAVKNEPPTTSTERELACQPIGHNVPPLRAHSRAAES